MARGAAGDLNTSSGGAFAEEADQTRRSSTCTYGLLIFIIYLVLVISVRRWKNIAWRWRETNVILFYKCCSLVFFNVFFFFRKFVEDFSHFLENVTNLQPEMVTNGDFPKCCNAAISLKN